METTLLMTGLVVVLAACFRGITGYGYALIAAIGLAGSMQTDSMVPLILINDLIITALILANRKHGAVDWSIAPLLLGMGLLGAGVGSFLVGFMDEATMKLMVAVIVFASAILATIKNPPSWMASRWIGASAALAVGALLAAFAVGGPLIVVWLLAGGTRREKTLGTLAVFFGAADLFGLMGRIATGQVNSALYELLPIYIPLTLFGYLLGHQIGKRLDNASWRKISALGLIVIALVSAYQTIMNLAA